MTDHGMDRIERALQRARKESDGRTRENPGGPVGFCVDNFKRGPLGGPMDLSKFIVVEY